VGFLTRIETKANKSFGNYKIAFKSQQGAKGMSLLPMAALTRIGGYNEFYHFWGAEDEDLHYRLTLEGLESIFYSNEVLLLHQWHTTYRGSSNNSLSKELQVYGIERINQFHYNAIKNTKTIIVNSSSFGALISQEMFDSLYNCNNELCFSNSKVEIDYLLNFIFNQRFETPTIITIKKSQSLSLKQQIKRFMHPNYLHEYYEMKLINDMLLKSLIFHSRYYYLYQVTSVNQIELRLINNS
jgi:hypothetical protein